MRLYILIIVLFIFAISIRCSNLDEASMRLEVDNSHHFKGFFHVQNSENITGNVTLNISNGKYTCFTNLPWGRGAGKISVDGQSIYFEDTLFLIIPALYGPTYTLSGIYEYEYNRERLLIWRDQDNLDVEYELFIE